MIACCRNINFNYYQMRTIKCRNYARYTPNDLRNDISNVDWTPIYQLSSVESAVQMFTSTLQTIFDTHAPLIEKRIKGRPCPWLNADVKKKMNNREQLLRKARKSKDSSDWQAYKRLRNECTKDVKKAKSNFHKENLNENIMKPRKFWATIKSVFPGRSTLLSSHNKSDNRPSPNIFSHFYSTMALALKKTISPLMDFTWRFIPQLSKRSEQTFILPYMSVLSCCHDKKLLVLTIYHLVS